MQSCEREYKIVYGVLMYVENEVGHNTVALSDMDIAKKTDTATNGFLKEFIFISTSFNVITF